MVLGAAVDCHRSRYCIIILDRPVALDPVLLGRYGQVCGTHNCVYVHLFICSSVYLCTSTYLSMHLYIYLFL